MGRRLPVRRQFVPSRELRRRLWRIRRLRPASPRARVRGTTGAAGAGRRAAALTASVIVVPALVAQRTLVPTAAVSIAFTSIIAIAAIRLAVTSIVATATIA